MIANARSCDAFKLSPNCERMRKCVCLAWRRSVGKMQERYSTSYPSSDTAGTCGYLERAIVRNLAIVTYYLVILSEQILSQSRMFGSSPHLHHRLVYIFRKAASPRRSSWLIVHLDFCNIATQYINTTARSLAHNTNPRPTRPIVHSRRQESRTAKIKTNRFHSLVTAYTISFASLQRLSTPAVVSDNIVWSSILQHRGLSDLV